MGKLTYSLAPEWGDDGHGGAIEMEDVAELGGTNGGSKNNRRSRRHRRHGRSGSDEDGIQMSSSADSEDSDDWLNSATATTAVVTTTKSAASMMLHEIMNSNNSFHGGYRGGKEFMQVVERRYPRELRRFVQYSSICCIHLFVIYVVLLLQPYNFKHPPKIYDVVVFGATPAGCAAAIAAGEMGSTVLLIEPSGHVGGMATEGGIGLRDEMDNRRITDPRHSQVRWGTLNALYYEDNDGSIPIWQPDNYVGERSFLQLLEDAGVEILFNTTFIEGPRGVLMDGSAPIDEPRIHALFLQDSTTITTTITSESGNSGETTTGEMSTSTVRKSIQKQRPSQPTVAAQEVDWIRGHFFIDATYEGELMQAAGVSFTFGRESSDKYGESLAGVTAESAAQFPTTISPYLGESNDGVTSQNSPDKDANGTSYFYEHDNNRNLLRYVGVGPDPRQSVGEADSNVMAYSYRVCLTQDPNNTVPVTPPEGYNPVDFELARRLVLAEVAAINEESRSNNPDYSSISRPWILYPYNHYENTNQKYMKYDACCGNSPFGIDAPGLSFGYANASRSERQRIVREHRYFVQGLIWFWQTDPAVPESIRQEYMSYGLCRDEFTDNGHFPRQLYVREASRMIGDYVFTQNDAKPKECRQDSVAIATWWFDIHDVQRVAVPVEPQQESLTSTTDASDSVDRNQTLDGDMGEEEHKETTNTSTTSWMVMNEGLVDPSSTSLDDKIPFDLPYWLLLPKHGEVTNLAVPNCPSVSHVAFSAIREEPTLWLLGQAAGTAAAIALSHGNPSFHDVDVIRLQQALRKQGSPIHWPPDRTC